MNKKSKLFIVEFGTPDGSMTLMSLMNSGQKPLYVVATSYDEAAQKALMYAEAKREENGGDSKSIVTPDGSLRLDDDDDFELTVKGVRIASDEVVW